MPESQNTVVPGTGRIFVAPVGTALPSTPEGALNAAFVDVGYTTEEGIGINRSQEIFRLRALQKRADIRRERQSEAFQVTFAMLEWSAPTVKLAFGGGEVQSVSGGYKYSPPSVDDALDERALVVEIEDGDDSMRLVVPKGNAIEAVSSTFARSSGATLPITFDSLDDDEEEDLWYVLSNSDAFDEGS
jgi:hypothetical protein